jgi:hypothetical protein
MRKVAVMATMLLLQQHRRKCLNADESFEPFVSLLHL